LLALGLGLLAAVGCQEETIQQYQVPREGPVKKASAGLPQLRILVAILRAEGQTWSFELVGPSDRVTAYKPAFEKFLHTVKFGKKGDAQPVTWTRPEEWSPLKGGTDPAGGGKLWERYQLAKNDRISELMVLIWEGDGGPLREHLKRWRKEIRLGPITEAELKKFSQTIKLQASEIEATFVDLLGPDPATLREQAEPETVTHSAPASWPKIKPSEREIGAGVKEKYVFSKDKQQVAITVSSAGGDWALNVKRWAGQLGLPNLTPEQLRQQTREVEVAGTEANLIDLGADGKAPLGQRTVAVMVERPGSAWFFKITGPANLVGSELANFEQFLKTVRFVKRAGAKDG
jgi:hypothetical protein